MVPMEQLQDGSRAEESHSRDAEPWNRPRGPVTKENGQTCIGMVGAPPQQEATSEQFCFWIPPDALVEKTQLITCQNQISGQDITFHGIIDEVHRRSRKRDMGDEIDEADGDLNYEHGFESDGFTYASASILRTEPPFFTPPRERSEVFLAGEKEASLAYFADEIDNPLSVGLIKNGGSHIAGKGLIDLDYLLGVNGGHLNVNGAAGRGTKSSFLLFVNWMLLHEAERQQRTKPSDPQRLQVVPIILNVKNFDLFYIDSKNNRFNEAIHLDTWQQLGIADPQPFSNVEFYAVQQPGTKLPVDSGRTSGVKPYSWSLRNIIEDGLLSYLFAEADVNDTNFSALVLDIENWLTKEQFNNDGSVNRKLNSERSMTTFEEFLEWVDAQSQAKDEERPLRNHHTSTWKKFHRRLLKITYESRGLIRRTDEQGHPLRLVKAETSHPVVVDLAALAGQPELQRFVVATIFRQLIEARTGTKAVKGLVYLVTLDELNRFAPRNSNDPITRLIETVAAEMRSQGIILLGAQQQASKVSEKVIENSAIRVIGKTGTLELESSVWRFLSKTAKRKAASLPLDEKLVIQDNFREPMHVRVPFPVWAMNPREEQAASPKTTASNGFGIINE